MTAVSQVSKPCSKCGLIKPVSEFYTSVAGLLGVESICKVCKLAYFAQRRDDPLFRKQQNERRKRWRKTRHQSLKDKERANSKAWEAVSRQQSPSRSLRSQLSAALRRRPSHDPATVEQLMTLWEIQGGRCAITGVVMSWTGGRGCAQPTSVSIDRIDNYKSYDKDNVRLVCHLMNVCKANNNDLVAVATFLQIADSLCNLHQNRGSTDLLPNAA